MKKRKGVRWRGRRSREGRKNIVDDEKKENTISFFLLFFFFFTPPFLKMRPLLDDLPRTRSSLRVSSQDGGRSSNRGDAAWNASPSLCQSRKRNQSSFFLALAVTAGVALGLLLGARDVLIRGDSVLQSTLASELVERLESQVGIRRLGELVFSNPRMPTFFFSSSHPEKKKNPSPPPPPKPRPCRPSPPCSTTPWPKGTASPASWARLRPAPERRRRPRPAPPPPRAPSTRRPPAAARRWRRP